MPDPTNAGIEAAAEAVSAMSLGQQAWGAKEFHIARVAATAAVAANQAAIETKIAKLADAIEVLAYALAWSPAVDRNEMMRLIAGVRSVISRPQGSDDV